MLHFQFFVAIAFILAGHVFESLTSPESPPCLKVLSPVADLTTIHDKLEFHFALQCQWPVSPSASSIASKNSPYDAMVHYCVALTTHTDAFERCFNNITKLTFDENSGWIYLKEQGVQNGDCLNVRVLEMIEQCSPQSNFQITGFKSNTFAVTAYIKVVHQELESASVNTDRFFFTTALLDTNNPMKALPSFDHSFQQLQQRHPTLFNKPGIVDSILGKNGNHQLNNFFHVDDANGVARRFKRYPRLPFVAQSGNNIADSTSTGILIYMKEMQRHGANNRLITWACGLSSHGQKLQSNLRVAILTSDTEANADLVDYLNNKCHVSIYLSQALSLPHVDGILMDQVLSSDAIQLIEWISTFHVLMLTNSNGDKQTDMLLMNYLPRCKVVPLTIVDASNPVVPQYWLEYIDAVIAPSKAAAFYNSMPLWETTDIPFGVIYSSLSDDWIKSAVCWQDLNSSVPNFTPSQLVSMVYLGRLALEKSPGILLKSLAWLLTSEFPNLLDHLAPVASSELIGEFRNRFHLKIIGDGPLYQPMQNFIAKYNMSKYFTFLQNLPPNALQIHLRSASALINPGIYGETFGLVHIEALTMGIPSIGFDLGGVKESLQVGMLIDHFSRSNFEQQNRDPIVSLAEAILLMFDSHQQFIEQRGNICLIAKEVFQQSFSLDAYVKSVLDIIQFMFSLPSV